MALAASRSTTATEEPNWRKAATSAPLPHSTSGSRPRTRGGGNKSIHEPTQANRGAAPATTSTRNKEIKSASMNSAKGPTTVPARKDTDKGPRRNSRRNTRTQANGTHSEATNTLTDASSVDGQSVSGTSHRKMSQNQNNKQSSSPLPPKENASGQASTTSSTLSGNTVAASSKLDRDLPPHLQGSAPEQDASTPLERTPADTKEAINSLIEQLRTTEIHRSSSPATHIDWAGDDDDELPDLNDWGYPKAGGLEPERAQLDLISPILENSLKALPLVDHVVPGGDEVRERQESEATTVTLVDKTAESVTTDTDKPVPSRPISPERTRSRGTRTKAPKSQVTGIQQILRESKAKNETKNTTPAPAPVALPSGKTEAAALPSPHPSLPLKPITSPFDKHASLPAKPTSPTLATSPSLPMKPFTNLSGQSLNGGPLTSATALASAPSPKGTPVQPRQGLKASIHAPQSPEEGTATLSPVRKSLQDRIQDCPPPIAAPSAPATPGTPNNRTPRQRYNRPNSVHAVSNAANTGSHGRTQSVPITPNRGGHRAHGISRPVIAGSAINMLAKTLAGSPKRNPSPSAV